MEIIGFKNVSVRQNGKQLLDNVSLTVRSGEKVGLNGPSGGGKTTILLTLLGAYRVNQGEVSLFGKSVGPDSIRYVRQSVAYIGQEPALGTDTARAALMVPFSFRANRKLMPDKERLLTVLTRVGLEPDILSQRIVALSGGEKQRLSIARALLLQKKIFLCDEITAALDGKNRDNVWALFSDPLFTVLSVSHDAQWLSRCGRRLKVEKGTIPGAAMATGITGGSSHGDD